MTDNWQAIRLGGSKIVICDECRATIQRAIFYQRGSTTRCADCQRKAMKGEEKMEQPKTKYTYAPIEHEAGCMAPFCERPATVWELRSYSDGKSLQSAVCEGHRAISKQADANALMLEMVELLKYTPNFATPEGMAQYPWWDFKRCSLLARLEKVQWGK